MSPHVEIESTRRAAQAIAEHVWGWEVPIYLFLGGLVAGLMLAVSASILLLGRDRVTKAMRLGLLAAPALLSLGMGALFLDLTYELHVFRFYTTLVPTSPMSLGSWVLVLVYPVQLGLILALPHESVAHLVGRFAIARRLQSWCEGHLRALAGAGLGLGVALGIYTGILLSATVARPLWSSGALGFLFLASGASTGVAALLAAERDASMSAIFARADIVLIAFELVVMALWLIGLSTQSPLHRAAAQLVLTGPYAPAFLGMVVFGGLVVPATLETLSLRGKALHSPWPPALVIAGGLLLRFVIVYAGQDVGFAIG